MRLRPEIAGIPESPLITIGTMAESLPGSIKLCYGEPDTATPEFISRAAYDAALAGHTFYTHTAGTPELRQAIATKANDLHGTGWSHDEIMATVGATMALYITIRACVGAGDNAIVISPAYGSFINAVRMSGAEPREVPLVRSGNRFMLDLDRVARAIDARTRLLLVNSPSNPTGWVATVDEQRALYQLAEHHGLVLLADEVYERIVFNGSLAPSFARLTGGATDHLVVVNSFSKTYNMTGWRLGWLQASSKMVERMASAAEFITSNPTAAVQEAGIVALRDGEEFIVGQRESYRQRRNQVLRATRGFPDWNVTDPDGAFFVFAKVDGVTDSASYAADLLRQTGVALTPGSAFGAAGEGHLRLCFAASPPALDSALARLATAIDVKDAASRS